MKNNLKKQIKIALQAAYSIIYSISPAFADSLRESTYKLWRYLKKRNHLPLLLRESEGLLIDVTNTSESDAGTGIQRVVNNIFSKIYTCRNKRNVIAVRSNFGNLITGNSYIAHFDSLVDRQEYEVPFQKKDSLFLLDSSWTYAREFSQILDIAKNAEVTSYALVHDLIPIQYPEVCGSQVLISAFCAWHDMILQKTDVILCNSRTTADLVVQYYEKKQFHRKSPLNLYYFHMGADISGGTQSARKEIEDFVRLGNVFLMVGTLEPRKGHMVVLQAFSKIKKENRKDIRLLIIGHDGWKNDEIRAKINSPEYRGRVLWIENASDEELRWAYAHANALIAASKDEGFGLPLVEAAHFSLPIICSDIPVFREVTQGNADYFKVMDAGDLARCVSEWIKADTHPDSGKIRIYTWQEAAQEILNIIDGKVEPYKILE